ncbi:hypothetical protein EXS71_03740 [Candidatus Uhrbacteria bacterium]|nr:hypothetical protein [Candidatus Uhrbacteria bacterium]
MEDDLMRIFGSDRMKSMMDRLGIPDDEAIENRVLSKSIEAAQKKVEGHNFDIRKHLLEYDDVLNKHRTAIYRKRREILDASKEATHEGERPLKQKVLEMIELEVERIVALHTSDEHPEMWDMEEIERAAKVILPQNMDVSGKIAVPQHELEGKQDLAERRTQLIQSIRSLVDQAYQASEESVGDVTLMGEMEKVVLLRTLDELWIEHLESMEHLRRGIGLQGYGQRDPLVEYKKEAYRMFHELLVTIHERVAHTIFKLQIARQTVEQENQRAQRPMQFFGAAKEMGEANQPPTINRQPSTPKVGRNDLCPCGSGKKYKKCHGA